MLMFIAAYNAYNIVIMPAQTKPQMLDPGLNNFITWVRCAQCLHECINTDVDIKVLVLKLCKFYGGVLTAYDFGGDFCNQMHGDK